MCKIPKVVLSTQTLQFLKFCLQLNLALDPSALALARTGTDGFQYLVPVGAPIPGQSESFQATLYGAIPVDAVHDMQVSPAQRENIEDYQRKPLLLRTGLARTF